MTTVWDAGAVLAGLLSAVPVTDGRRHWELADPYLWRHLLQHAQDADRVDELLTDRDLLVHATPDSVLTCLQNRTDSASELLDAVYRTAYQPRRWGQPRTRRDLLAIQAARYRAPWTIPPPPDDPDAWQPLWATGSRISATIPEILTDTHGATAVTVTTLDGRPVAVTTSDDRIWSASGLISRAAGSRRSGCCRWPGLRAIWVGLQLPSAACRAEAGVAAGSSPGAAAGGSPRNGCCIRQGADQP